MTPRENLIELLEHESAFSRYLTDDERRAKLANYLLRNGVVVPPIKLGDTVYWHNGIGVITEHTIQAMQYTLDGKKNIWRLDLGEGLMPVYPHHALFLTKEEAEKEAKKQMIAHYKYDMERAKKLLAEAEKGLTKLEAENV